MSFLEGFEPKQVKEVYQTQDLGFLQAATEKLGFLASLATRKELKLKGYI